MPGALEIHHISTGRGNSTLCIFPDGTTLLIDAGAVRGKPELLAPLRPAGERDVFATALVAASAAVNERLVGRLRSTWGHAVVRVAPGGGSYAVDVVDDRNESDRVLATFGPYESQAALR